MAFNYSNLYTCNKSITSSIVNITSSYTNQINEPSMVTASVIMFILAVVFFYHNLFNGMSNVSAILDPLGRLIFSSSLSLLLPVMSYLLSEAKNGAAAGTDLALRARLILVWMLLVELLRKKVDEIHVQGYLGTVQRAGHVVWLGNLVFFNIQSVGRKAVFGILWILCTTRLVQRIVFTEVDKRSYAYGKNPQIITDYMAQMPVEGAVGSWNDLLKSCKYIVTGEDKLVKEATPSGYKLNDIADSDVIVTVGKVWQFSDGDPFLAALDRDGRLRRLCLSFAFFKLLRRRLENLEAITSAEANDVRNYIFRGRDNHGEWISAEALFQVMNDELNFLCEYYHSAVPVVFASSFFFLANYILLPLVLLCLCPMIIIISGHGDVLFAFRSITTDNYILQDGITKLTSCLLHNYSLSEVFFFTLDISITVILFIIFFYQEVWELIAFLLSNWFMVSLLCEYAAKSQWRGSTTVRGAFRCIHWLRSKTSHGNLSLKQFSVLNLRWPPVLEMPAVLFLMVRTVPVPIEVKRSTMEYLVAHVHGGVPLSNGMSVLHKYNNMSHSLSWVCQSSSVSEVILTWHIATSLLEAAGPGGKIKDSYSYRVATSLSKYCAYLVAFHPELLPDNQDNTERVFEAVKVQLMSRLGWWDYFFSWQRARVKKMMTMETAEAMDHEEVVHNGAKLWNLLKTTDGDHLERTWKLLACLDRAHRLLGSVQRREARDGPRESARAGRRTHHLALGFDYSHWHSQATGGGRASTNLKGKTRHADRCLCI